MVHKAMLKPKLTTIFDRSANPLNATMEPLKKQNGVYAENATCMVNGNMIILALMRTASTIPNLWALVLVCIEAIATDAITQIPQRAGSFLGI